jgi:ribosomal-protein-alanine N-acetyltransferase
MTPSRARSDRQFLETDRLFLSLPDKTMAGIICDYYLRNREFLQPWEPLRDEDFFTESHQKQLIRNELVEERFGSAYRFWLFKKVDSNLTRTIGCVVINNIIGGVFQSCFLGYKLDQDELNQGYMTEAVRAVIRFAFDQLGLHRIEANIIPGNTASMRVVEKLGSERGRVAQDPENRWPLAGP